MIWPLPSPIVGLSFAITAEGVIVSEDSGDWPSSTDLRRRRPLTAVGWTLPEAIPVLLEKGLAELSGNRLTITHDDFMTLEDEGIDAFSDIAAGAPFNVQIECSGAVATRQFRLQYEFYAGARAVHVERLGAFVLRDGEIYRLAPDVFRVVSEVERFNALADDERTGYSGFQSLATIRDTAIRSGIDLDALLRAEKIIVSPTIGVRLLEEDGNQVSYAPGIGGVPEAELEREFMRADDVGPVISVSTPEGGRVRLVLDGEKQEVLRRMQRVRHVVGRERSEVLRNPQAIFDGVASHVQLGELSRRIKGIGDFPFVTRPYIRAGIFDEWNVPDRFRDESSPTEKNAVGLVCTYADGTTAEVPFKSPEAFLEFHNAAKAAWHGGGSEIMLEGKTISLDRAFIGGLDDVADRLKPPNRSDDRSPKSGRFLLIHTNEEELDFSLPTGAFAEAAMPIPKSLRAQLKPHQVNGFQWLCRSFLGGRGGCLLADDMGLGKTLQVLTFIAWLLENQQKAIEARGRNVGPTLIVAPLILLENETWVEEMQRFFADDGEVFGAPLVLRDREIRRLKAGSGKETEIGTPVLRVDEIATHKVVLTNYETVTNYQHSLARIQWSVVVTDEAQEYKTPSTRISHALKSLKADFRIGSTGTPVETRLLDVWNLFDFLQPGLLSTAKEFTRDFDQPASSRDGHQHIGDVLSSLKQRLGLNQKDGFVMRRDKAHLDGLPGKSETTIRAPLSAEQRNLHQNALALLRGGATHPFEVLHMLVKVYQHPALLHPEMQNSGESIISMCPKLESTIQKLQEIRAKGEKCLVFTRSVAMQQLLASAFAAAFELEVGIVNGAAPRKGATARSKLSRDKLIRRFRESAGFDILILSPDVAGIGLTLVEANHVIHYGRWWNPAKEMQATDRVYRIGQTRDVQVYYPLAFDPRHEFETFDEKLDQLLARRKGLAADFLTPLPTEDELRDVLARDLSNEQGDGRPIAGPLEDREIRQLTWDRFEALVAASEEKGASHVLLTPKANDGGVDVVAITPTNIRLIQCKHSRGAAACDESAVMETIAGLDFYRARLPGNLNRKLQPIVATNATFTRAAERMAREYDVELMSGAAIAKRVEKSRLTVLDVERWSMNRLANLNAVIEAIQRA